MTMQIVSKQTQMKWWINAALFSSAIIAAFSGIYFLFLPSGGFRGGRNPLYHIQILFSRQTWNDLHTWGGVVMIAVAAIHLILHRPWVVNMTRRILNELSGKCGCMNSHGRWNLLLNSIMALCFVLTALSGVYFLFFPHQRWAIDPMILFSRATWDWIHTGAGILLIAAAVIHFSIHWKWVAKVTHKMIGMVFLSQPNPQPEKITNT